jgi:hypothetical protein
MKTCTFIFAFLVSVFSSTAQVTSGSEVANRSSSFSSDEIIYPKALEDQRNLHLSVAFNGWLYSAFTINDTLAHKGGIYVAYSKNNGLTWEKFITYQFPNSYYPFTDIVVAGTDTAHLSVFIAGALKNLNTSNYTLYIDKFDGRNGNLLAGQVFAKQMGAHEIAGMAMATDYQSPSAQSSPFSLGLLYSLHCGISDSVLFAVSSNGGNSFPNRYALASTSSFFRNVTLAYGKSGSNPNGTYFAAWEMMANPTAQVGHIFATHTNTSISSSWMAPVCLDSISSKTLNKVCHPNLTCQANTTLNDSSGLTSIVVCERQAAGTNQVVGFYSLRSVSSLHWHMLKITSMAGNNQEPNAIFEPYSNKFLLTCFDSTSGQLAYLNEDVNLTSPDSWNMVSNQYNDQPINLKFPHPQIAINPQLHQAAFVWIAEGANGTGAAMFDAEYSGLLTGTSLFKPLENKILPLFPNPATDQIQIPVNLDESQDVHIIIYDILGNEMGLKSVFSAVYGQQNLLVDVRALPAGVYICQVSSHALSRTMRFVLSR